MLVEELFKLTLTAWTKIEINYVEKYLQCKLSYKFIDVSPTHIFQDSREEKSVLLIYMQENSKMQAKKRKISSY